MSRRTVLAGAAALALATSLAGTPAWAEGEFTITVTPAEGLPAATFTVTGDATDPVCADDGVTVTLHYTKPNGATGATTVSTTTDAAGHFSAQLTVPDNAYAGEEAFVSAVIADCTPPDATPTSTRSSISVDFEVLAYEGDFDISDTSGKPGDTFEFVGTNCWGGTVAVFFGDELFTGEPEADKTFGGEIEVPDLPSGTYEVGAECPGTDYRVFSYRLVNPVVAPPAPPARPVVRRPTFTG